MQITQFSQYRCTQLQYRFAVISEAPSTYQSWGTVWLGKFLEEKGFDLFIYIKKSNLADTDKRYFSSIQF